MTLTGFATLTSEELFHPYRLFLRDLFQTSDVINPIITFFLFLVGLFGDGRWHHWLWQKRFDLGTEMLTKRTRTHKLKEQVYTKGGTSRPNSQDFIILVLACKTGTLKYEKNEQNQSLDFVHPFGF